MLLPNKHSDPDHTVLAAATVALRVLKRGRLMTFDEVHAAMDRANQRADFLMGPALSLLFILGLVNYLPKADAFEYVGRP